MNDGNRDNADIIRDISEHEGRAAWLGLFFCAVPGAQAGKDGKAILGILKEAVWVCYKRRKIFLGFDASDDGRPDTALEAQARQPGRPAMDL
jgi:hypothetical protein